MSTESQLERRNLQLYHCAERISNQKAEIRRLQEAAGTLAAAILWAEAVDAGEQISIPQPHPQIVSIVAGNRNTMAAQQAEIYALQA